MGGQNNFYWNWDFPLKKYGISGMIVVINKQNLRKTCKVEFLIFRRGWHVPAYFSFCTLHWTLSNF
jgi:hypothetical protein